MRTKIAYWFVLCVVVLCTSCGGLSRGNAAEQISQKLDSTSNTNVTVFFNTGSPTKEDLQNDPKELGVLYRMGYVGCEMTEEYTNNSNPYFPIHYPAHCIVVLTDKGNQASAGWEIEKESYAERWIVSAKIPVAKPELIEVTGVTERDNDASVTFTWREKSINDIGQALGYGQPKPGSAAFRKYDDGWRLGFMESNGFPMQ